MSASSHQPPPRPTLEDLLRFKRAERPSPEFWEEFDRGLRQKQLAALIKQPQGWARMRPVLLRGLRWAVPATAAAAVALVILQIPRGSSPGQASVVAADVSRPMPAAQSLAPLPITQVAVAVPEIQPTQVVQVATASVVAHGESLPEPTQVAAVGASDHSLPWSAASLAYSQPSSYRSGELYPVRLVSRDTPRANSSWTSHFTQIVRDLTAEQDEAQVKQLASLNLSAPNQYVAAAAPAAGTQMAASNNRSGRSLTDREFRDLDARFGVKGSSVSIKF